MVLEDDDVAVAIGPAEKAADVAVGRLGQRPAGLRVGNRSHPQIAHAIARRKIGEMLAVRADPNILVIGIVEIDAARDEPGIRRVGTRQPGKRQNDTERCGAAQKLAAADRACRHFRSSLA